METRAAPSLLARVGGVLELARLENVLMAGIGVLLGALVAGGEPQGLDLTLATLATMLVVAGGNALNDATDVAVDRVAHPTRPLPAGVLSTRAALGMTIACFLVALAAAALVSIGLLLVVLGAQAALVAYDVHLKRAGLIGNLVVAALVGLTFLAGALAAGALTAPVIFLAGLAFLANVAREVWKDAEDAPADQDRRTVARVHGPRRAHLVAVTATLLAVALSPLPLIVSDFGGAPFLLVVAAADLLFIFATLQPTPGRAQRLSKAGMAVALAAFLTGAIA